MSMSLWLVPHQGNPFTKSMQELITDEVPKQFDQKKQNIPPHVAITSGIDTAKVKSPQEWLDGIQLPEFKAEFEEVVIMLDELRADDDTYRKMNISVKDDDNLKKLAKACARDGAKDEDDKCMTLLFADLPTRESQNKIALIEMKIGFSIGDIFACCGGTLCMGGHLVLMDTSSKDIEQWKAVAKRETPWVMWRATHNLI